MTTVRGAPLFALVVVVVVASAAALASCSTFRTEAAPGSDASAPGDDAGIDAAPDSGFTVVNQGDAGAGALHALWASGPNDVYAAGDDGLVLHFTGDPTPARVILGAGIDLGGIWGSGPNEILAVGTQRNTDNGPIFRRLNGRWIEIGIAPHGLRSVWGIGNLRVAGGNDGAIYHGPPDNPLGFGNQLGLPPEVQQTNFAPIIYSIGGNSESSAMAAADVDSTAWWDGTIWHSYDDPIDRTRAFRAIWGPAGDAVDLYEGANYYGLWHFTGKENPVVQVNEEKDSPDKFSRTIWGIWGPSKDKIVCVGDNGRIMTYDNTTQVVTVRPSPTGKNLYAVTGTSLDDVWIVGEDELVLHGRITF